MLLCSPIRHILGFPTEELLRGPVLKELQEQLSQQMPYLHLIHWCVCVFISYNLMDVIILLLKPDNLTYGKFLLCFVKKESLTCGFTTLNSFYL